MSLTRYLMVAYGIWLAALTSVVAITWEPEKMAPGFYGRLIFGLPIAAAILTLHLSGSAQRTIPEKRLGFRSYREANLMLFGTLAAFALCAAYVMFF